MALAEEFPPFGLRITAGPLELGPITDEVIPSLVGLARDGIHDPEAMPFYFPWSTAPSDEIGVNMAQFYWQSRAQLSPARWSLNLAVRFDGEVVGCQDLAAVDFPVTRTAETGSWLGLRHQGRGIGTRMRPQSPGASRTSHRRPHWPGGGRSARSASGGSAGGACER